MMSNVRPGPAGICREHEALCAPCGAALTGPVVALTFAYDYFEVVELDSEFEVQTRPAPCLLLVMMKTTLGSTSAAISATSLLRDRR